MKKKLIELGINFVSVTTDGATSIIRKNIGFVKLLKQKVNHNFVEFHYFVKSTFKLLESVVTKVVNFIVAPALNKRQFTKLLNVVDNQFFRLIMYNNVRLNRFQPIC